MMKILMFPWLAHGHIFPFLELAKKLLNHKDFHIYICSTAINLTSINNFITARSLENSIEAIELHLEPNPNFPPHLHTTKHLPPNLNPTLHKAFQTSKSSFSHILAALRPDLVIFDAFQPWAAALGVPAVHFSITGAATAAFSHHHYVRRGAAAAFAFPELRLGDGARRSLDGIMEFLRANVFASDPDLFFANINVSAEVALIKTCRAVEGKYVDYVSSVTGKRILTVGPLVGDQDEDQSSDADADAVMQWLGGNPQNSTVYICFGSEYLFSEMEIAEMAKGLSLCRARFLWVLPGASAELLPAAFREEVVGERGMVLAGWAPQARILGHSSIGAFVSHCGWSSLNESVYHGVPVVGMPIKCNMFVDAKMLAAAGVCVEVGGFEAEAIAAAINGVGEEMRRRAREMSERMREEEGRGIGEVAEVLWQICCKNENKVTS